MNIINLSVHTSSEDEPHNENNQSSQQIVLLNMNFPKYIDLFVGQCAYIEREKIEREEKGAKCYLNSCRAGFENHIRYVMYYKYQDP